MVNVKTVKADDQRNKVRELKNELDDLNEELDKITGMKLVRDEFHLSCKLCRLKVKNIEDMKQHIRVQQPNRRLK